MPNIYENLKIDVFFDKFHLLGSSICIIIFNIRPHKWHDL